MTHIELCKKFKHTLESKLANLRYLGVVKQIILVGAVSMIVPSLLYTPLKVKQ